MGLWYMAHLVRGSGALPCFIVGLVGCDRWVSESFSWTERRFLYQVGQGVGALGSSMTIAEGVPNGTGIYTG